VTARRPDARGARRIGYDPPARARHGHRLRRRRRRDGRHFRDGWFEPGDLATLDVDGQLVIHGRADDMMIMNGINIYPVEIERILERHPAVETAAAFPLPSGVHGQIPVAAVELRAGMRCAGGELVAFARDALGVRAPASGRGGWPRFRATRKARC
jgi:acyl-CoA synthetase (AMP-forming)/AMP-acid ligase II